MQSLTEVKAGNECTIKWMFGSPQALDIILFAQRNEYHGAFHGKPFHDNEIAWVYLLVLDRPEEAFTPEACEVESVHWFSVREILRAMRENDPRFCLREAEFRRLLPYLAQKFGIPVDKL